MTQLLFPTTLLFKLKCPDHCQSRAVDEFDRISIDGGDRGTVQEGLIIATASSVTTGSSVVFDKDASKTIAGVDLTAGTTGSSVLDNFAALAATFGMRLAGGDGKNTIKGGAGTDFIQGGSDNDLLTGNDGNDTIYGGSSGKDSIVGGGDDSIANEVWLEFRRHHQRW